MPKDEVERRVSDAARDCSASTDHLKRKPRALSGGQRQRVAMGRAIVRQPQAFLMDEPLSNLDAKLRVQMRAEIARLQNDLGVTTIYVTHDQTEAMTMGDRVAVMRKGELQQVDDPQVLYDRPVNLFVGGFIGSPAMNMLQARLEATNGALVGCGRRASGSRSAEPLHDPAGAAGVRRSRHRPRHPPREPRGRSGRDRRRGRRPSPRRSRAARGTRLGDHGPRAIKARQAETDETRELAQDAGAADDDSSVGLEEGRDDSRLRASTPVAREAGRVDGDCRRHGSAALLRPGHRARDLREHERSTIHEEEDRWTGADRRRHARSGRRRDAARRPTSRRAPITGR